MCIEAWRPGTRVQEKPIGELSKGFKQRTGLAQALIHDPDILILDEPTSGLDPLQIIGIRDLIKSLAGSKTIIFSTHILQEVSPVTDRVVIINEGRIIADGKVRELAREADGQQPGLPGAGRDRHRPRVRPGRELDSVAEVKPLGTADGSRFELRGPFDGDIVGDVARLAMGRGWNMTDLHQAPYSLEDTFIALTRKSLDHNHQTTRGVA